MKQLLLLFLVTMAVTLQAQTCTDLGQNPNTAFPVCGSAVFRQSSVSLCGTRIIPTPCTAQGALFMDKNPYWYKFTCFSAGTLGFEITPVNLSSDYDWQLFDITGRNPMDVYTDRSLFVACNWSGETGRTGTSAAGTSLTVCEGRGQPLYSRMPTLIKDHEYLLLVSHFTNTQSGYTLAFGGGTAGIIDSTAVKIKSARPSCDGKLVYVKMNKKVRCNSLAANGSDFTINSTTSKITGASGYNCSNGFDMDSLVLQLDVPLLPGNYTVTSKNGSDGNTLLDICQAPLAVGEQISFTVQPLQPTPFDSIVPPGCSPSTLRVIFSKPVQCSSIAANGSDFVLDPASGATITGVTLACTGGTTRAADLRLSQPLQKGGRYRVTLVAGTDGNTIIDECGQHTPAQSAVTVTASDTVSAKFTYHIQYTCKADTVQFVHPGGNGITTWAWGFGSRGTSAQQNPVYVYTRFGPQQVSLKVSNGVCIDSVAQVVMLDNELKAGFSAPSILCPQDDALCKDSSIGKITLWAWEFGNGFTSTLQNPPAQRYPPATTQTRYNIRLIVKDSYNCYDTITKPVTVVNNCYIAVASAFTPNGDGLNDYLYPINAFKAIRLVFRVYNRFGQLVFETTDFTRKWDGTFKGMPQPGGTYVYTLQYTHADTGKEVLMKGTSVLLR